MLSKQCELIVRHINLNGYITPLVASNYGITRLASRIYDLKQAGYDIAKETVKDLAGRRYTRYEWNTAPLALHGDYE